MDSAAYISIFFEFFTSQYEEYIETSTFPTEQDLTTLLYVMDFLFESLHGYRSEVVDAGQHVPGIFIWVFIKAWEIQERYYQKQFKD